MYIHIPRPVRNLGPPFVTNCHSRGGGGWIQLYCFAGCEGFSGTHSGGILFSKWVVRGLVVLIVGGILFSKSTIKFLLNKGLLHFMLVKGIHVYTHTHT